MTALVIAEHDNASLKAATLNTVTAAAACGGDVHVLVAGENAAAVAQAQAQAALERATRAETLAAQQAQELAKAQQEAAHLRGRLETK